MGRFDRDGDGRLDTPERAAARDYLQSQPIAQDTAGASRPSSPTSESRALEPVKAGGKIDEAQLPDFSARSLYDPAILRTISLAFEDADWERQLALFAPTDIWVPARVTIDHHTYAGVGVHFRPLPVGVKREPGYKRSLVLRFDHSDPKQSLSGQRELQLLDSFSDPTFLRTSLALDAARDSGLPAPRANFVKVAINGESWGVYVNQQPFDESLLRENFGTSAGARWTVLSGGSLTYLGEDPAPYRAIYHLDTPESPEAWSALIKLCRTLAQTEPEDLATALAPQLDVNNALRFIAWENAVSNQNGYLAHGGGYGLYLAPSGRFYLVPLAGESTFRMIEKETYERNSRSSGPRGGGASRGGGGPREARSERSAPRGNDQAAKNNPTEAPRAAAKPAAAPSKTQTDLAMMLSYSLVYKCDRDDDSKVTREEWSDFATGWFTIMDDEHTGLISHDQFIDKFRWFVTPPSMRDGKSRQTYGADDPSAVIGGQFFAEMQPDANGRVNREAFVAAFDRIFSRWSGAANKPITQPQIDAGLEKMIPVAVFAADQVAVAKQDKFIVNDNSSDGPGGGRGGDSRGGQRGGEGGGGGRGGGGSGLSVGLPIPGLQIGTDSFRRRSEGSVGGRTLVIERSQLEVLAGMDDPHRALTNKLLQPLIFRWRYYGYLHEFATNWLAWERLAPLINQRVDLIGSAVQNDTHKPDSYEHFVQRIDQEIDEADAEPSLKKIAADRRELILNDEYVQRHPDGK